MVFYIEHWHYYCVYVGEWISPEMTGVRPLPCAAFSLTRVDQHRVVLFGGRQLLERTDQLHILDMENWVGSSSLILSSYNAILLHVLFPPCSIGVV